MIVYRARLWAVRHARRLEAVYQRFERMLVRAHPLCKRIGYSRLERPAAAVERVIKGFLFDCQMCGQCVLSATGMSCPMNCPKNMRNGPCGGVRPNGCCEVNPNMRCVWVEAWTGNQQMRNREAIESVQPQLDWRLRGTSSWLRIAREKREQHSFAKTS